MSCSEKCENTSKICTFGCNNGNECVGTRKMKSLFGCWGNIVELNGGIFSEIAFLLESEFHEL